MRPLPLTHVRAKDPWLQTQECYFFTVKLLCGAVVQSQGTGKSHLNKSVVIAFCFQECWWAPVGTPPPYFEG